jgi:hypothetical protein
MAMPERFRPDQRQFPLLDDSGAIAGWSTAAPHFDKLVLRHAEAERVIGKPIVILPALLLRAEHQLIAGGRVAEEGIWVLAIAHANCLRRMPVVINH